MYLAAPFRSVRPPLRTSERNDRRPLAAVTGGTGFSRDCIFSTALARYGLRLRLLARRDSMHPAFTVTPVLEVSAGHARDPRPWRN